LVVQIFMCMSGCDCETAYRYLCVRLDAAVKLRTDIYVYVWMRR